MSRKRNLLFQFLIAAIVCLATNTALCHRLNVFAWVEGSQIAGEAYFAGGGKAANLPLVVLDEQGKEIVQTATDADGSFRMPHPAASGDLIFRIDAGEGHAGQFVLHQSPSTIEQSTSQPTSPNENISSSGLDCEALLDQKLAPINEQLARLAQRRNTLQDALTGIGFILGIFGAAALAWTRKKI